MTLTAIASFLLAAAAPSVPYATSGPWSLYRGAENCSMKQVHEDGAESLVVRDRRFPNEVALMVGSSLWKSLVPGQKVDLRVQLVSEGRMYLTGIVTPGSEHPWVAVTLPFDTAKLAFEDYRDIWFFYKEAKLTVVPINYGAMAAFRQTGSYAGLSDDPFAR